MQEEEEGRLGRPEERMETLPSPGALQKALDPGWVVDPGDIWAWQAGSTKGVTTITPGNPS